MQPIFDAACAGCHGGATPSDGLDLSGDAYDAIVGTFSADVPTMAQIAPYAPDDSYLWHKVSGTQIAAGGAGGIMPKPPDPPLSAGDLAILESWILGGAPP